jgi:hypothetical protein
VTWASWSNRTLGSNHWHIGIEAGKKTEIEPTKNGDWTNWHHIWFWDFNIVPSGKRTKNYRKSSFLIGKSAINSHFQELFSRYLSLEESLKITLENGIILGKL